MNLSVPPGAVVSRSAMSWAEWQARVEEHQARMKIYRQLLRSCPSCEVEWSEADTCWLCGAPGVPGRAR